VEGMDYFQVTFPAGARLGMSVISREDSSLPVLGNTVVDSVEDNGFAKEGNVERGDFILSVNDRYVAFDSNAEVIKLLKSFIQDNQTLKIYFCRPNQFDWQQIQRPGTENPIKEGMIQKLHSGIFKKWNTRTLCVSRENLSYSYEGVTKGKFSVEREVGHPKVAVGYPHQQGVFEFRCGDKDLVIQTNNPHTRNMWMHAIDTALNKTFFQPLRANAPAPAPAVQPNNSSNNDASEAYLRMGRSALLKQQSGGASARTLQRRSSGSGSQLEGAIYKILSLSKVQAAAGPDNIVSLDGIPDPSKIIPALIDYDYSLEQRVLAQK